MCADGFKIYIYIYMYSNLILSFRIIFQECTAAAAYSPGNDVYAIASVWSFLQKAFK